MVSKDLWPWDKEMVKLAIEHSPYYRRSHGLHVIDNVFVDSCPVCGLRAQCMIFARLRGLDPDKAMEDFAFVREITLMTKKRGHK